MAGGLRKAFLVWTFVCLIGTMAYAQGSAKSSLSGLVVDSAGGVIPGATVSVKNPANGLTSEVVTNESGAFSVPALDVGTYSVTVSLSGFKTAMITDLRLVAGQPGSIQVKLEVGNLTETIEVKGGTELVQTQSAAVSSTISAVQIQNLPLTIRNALSFVAMLPGVDQVGAVRDSTLFGLPEQTINITIDGVNSNNNMRLVVQHDGPGAERAPADQYGREAGRHDREGAAEGVQDPHRSHDQDRDDAAQGHHRQHNQGVQHARHIG